MPDIFKLIRDGMRNEKIRREARRRAPVYRVRSAESPNGGAWIPGAAADAERLAEKSKHEWRVEGDGNYELFHNVCELCGAVQPDPLQDEG